MGICNDEAMWRKHKNLEQPRCDDSHVNRLVMSDKLGPCPTCLDHVKPCKCQIQRRLDDATESLRLLHLDRNGKLWVDSELSQEEWDERGDKGRSLALKILGVGT